MAAHDATAGPSGLGLAGGLLGLLMWDGLELTSIMVSSRLLTFELVPVPSSCWPRPDSHSSSNEEPKADSLSSIHCPPAAMCHPSSPTSSEIDGGQPLMVFAIHLNPEVSQGNLVGSGMNSAETGRSPALTIPGPT